MVTPSVRLLSPIRAGGMGSVWLAEHAGLRTKVVVKFMLGELDGSSSARHRFSREAAAAAQVKSPHVVQMLDHGLTSDGTPFIVMEHLEGHDLGVEIARKGALDPRTAVLIIGQVAKALSRVHSAGLLHRDIKPDNIFLCIGDPDDDVFVKLLDFGIAKNHHVEGEATLDTDTRTGQVVGTPFYMSPEQVTAQKELDRRSDLWSLGVVAFEALTGKRPFDGPSFGALAVKIATADPPRPSSLDPTLPAAVDAWFAKACARSPDARFASAKELDTQLRAAFEGVVSLPPIPSAMLDSGPRDGTTSSPRGSQPDGRGSQPGDPASGSRTPDGRASDPSSGRPSFALAPTQAGGSADGAPLGRSEAGASVGIRDEERPARGSRGMLVVALVAVVVAVGAGVAIGRGSNADPSPTSSASASATTTAARSTGPRRAPAAPASSVPAPRAVASEEELASSVPSAASSAPDASTASAPSSTPSGAPSGRPVPSARPVVAAPSNAPASSTPPVSRPDAAAPTTKPPHDDILF